MPGSVWGQEFRITTFGESHGGGIGVVVEGITPGLEIDPAMIQHELDRRRPGQSAVSTTRREPDTAEILSGVFEGRATGTPLLLLIRNRDQRPQAYDEVKNLFRPGHADFAYQQKYGLRDYRGGGRSSGRETAARVAAGAIAKMLLARHHIAITAYVKRAAGISCENIDFSAIEKNAVRAADLDAAAKMQARIVALKSAGNSAGGIVECVIRGVPAGLGEPVFDKLDADLAKAMLSLGAVKGIEFGEGFAAVDLTGRENNDEIDVSGFLSNHAGGITGGISTGQEIVFRLAVKPTASISQPQRTIDGDGRAVECRTIGRHDPFIGARLVPVVEAMSAIVLVDHLKRQEALRENTVN
ncbi:MAG: chorismate synthase [Victivallales bacterium]|nr:chorismate synthase [Victivallales bacterium]